ncbi:hypothetical protein JQ554_03490 [Bradyrhizobium diazoefficiens]|nr:hypothetical protein [Bradyrhizobium diazoefficiens]MBR0963132.1 hypothetical protein [Bradyrhizobium diazoefficiens]MBR0977292.1 hypothetical protein [Bradyrhizobium diazoefficiens]MBR1005937.1 hypothetical protein [Bradyrhizobium diazoefficiens]MBR1012410.1 hypothetical protein [Bradyrhizobium diazoefficiens]MBR1049752.1 hypothetical protein [Bradyrhizobium diazoefficiens]
MPADLLRLDLVVPVLMSCAMLWWVSRRLSWTARLATAAVTLALIIGVLLVERGWGQGGPST